MFAFQGCWVQLLGLVLCPSFALTCLCGATVSVCPSVHLPGFSILSLLLCWTNGGGGASHCWIWAENLSAFVIQVSHRDEVS